MKLTDELLAIFQAEADEYLERMTAELEKDPADWDVNVLFTISHNMKGMAGVIDAAPLADTAHALEELFSLLRAGARRDESMAELAQEGARLLHVCADPTYDGPSDETEAFRAKVEEYCKARGAAVHERPEPHRTKRSKDASSTAATASTDRSTLRVGVASLDRLLDLAGELHATGFAMEELGERLGDLVTRLAELERRDPQAAPAHDIGRLTGVGYALRREFAWIAGRYAATVAQVQDAVRLLRMVPLSNMGNLLRQVVRDACQETGKQARFLIEGAETEIDRVVLDRLRDPLVHLLRNAVVHGIEMPETRSTAGKPAEGRIELRARTAGAWIEISIVDDGRGIHREAVRRRAIDNGLISAQQAEELTDAELFDLIFQPGFSTAEAVSQIAGRGVGLDIVRRNLSSVGGTVSVHSRPDRGTEFRIRVPLTRLTTRGVVVRVGDRPFAVSIESIERTAEWEPGTGPVVDGRELISIDGELVPVTLLAEALDLPYEGAKRMAVLVLRQGNVRRAFAVDEVIGERDILLRPLPWNVRGAAAIIGGTVFTGGELVPILDGEALIELHSRRRSHARATEAPESERVRRILVVDDSVTSRTLQKIILTSAGFDVILAVDGEEAWRLIEGGEPVDLVIADIEMPKMDGITLTRRIRSLTQALPVILVTSLGQEKDRRAGAEAGADAYIVKGAFDQDELLAAVARLL